LKKPPYKAYRKKDKEKPPIEIPEKIDTPQAEQLALDIYKLYETAAKHWKKVAAVVGTVSILLGGWGIYRWHQINTEKKAALLVDKGLFLLRENKEKEAVKLFKKAVKEYPEAPSSKIAAFLAGKLSNNTELLLKAKNYQDFLVSPPSITTLAAESLNRNKTEKAEKFLNELKRDRDWTYPEGLEYRIIAGIKKGNLEEAKNALEALKGDYPNLPITNLSQQLLQGE